MFHSFHFLGQIHYLHYTLQYTTSSFRLTCSSLQVAKDKHPSEYLRNYDSIFCNKVSITTFNLTNDETEIWRNKNDLTRHTMGFWDRLDCSWHLCLRSYSRSLTMPFILCFFPLTCLNSQASRNSSETNTILNILVTASAIYMITWKGFTSHIFLYHLRWGSVLYYISPSVKSFSSSRA